MLPPFSRRKENNSMTKELQIGEKTLELRPSALTVIMYDKTFGGNLNDDLTLCGSNNPGHTIDTAMKLAFLMAKQAEKPNDIGFLLGLSEEDYYRFLFEFDAQDFTDNAQDIMYVYMKATEEKSKPKK